jgi:hypothetical protein
MDSFDFDIIRNLAADINDTSVLMLSIRRYFEYKQQY